ILFEGEVKAVIELASFHPFSAIHQIFLDQLSESIGVVLNMIIANMRTEQLLQQSQSLTQELQTQSGELTQQQDALKSTNSALEQQALELEDKARLLERQNIKVEEKNREVELARMSLEEKAEQLALVSKYKSEFLANMSHELRTPLNSLLILARVLSENQEANMSEKQLEYARSIYGSGSDLLKLINEVLDLSKMEAGKLQIEPTGISPRKILDSAHKNFRPLADEKKLGFTVEIGEGVPDQITTDPQRVEQVLNNLLSNAFKFTESGSIKLTLALSAPPRDAEEPSIRGAENVLAISVADTGIGIARNKQRIIFEAFQQADGSTSRKYGGTGLGLSISREIARALGGEIHVESRYGEGSTFTLYLPLSMPKSQAAAAQIDEPELSGLETPAAAVLAQSLLQDPALTGVLAGKKVLIVDDDLRNLFAIRTLLEQHRMQVFEAENGRAAIQLVGQHPDLAVILMDIMMPEMDGFETIQRIRSELAKAHLPIIAVTAKTLRQDRDRCMEAGASDYLAKPVDESKLLELLKSWAGDRINGAV
ncbi:MAG: response regulator, partial [Candidatus Binataceae bacterium]